MISSERPGEQSSWRFNERLLAMSCFPNNTSPCTAGKSERARLCSESNSVHRTPSRSHIVRVTCQLASLLFSLSLFFFLFPFFPARSLSRHYSPHHYHRAFWSPSELDPYNTYAFTSLYDLRNEPEMSQPRFVVPFYSDYALLRGAMSPLIVVPLPGPRVFSSAFARLNCRTVASKVGRSLHDDSVPFFHSTSNLLFSTECSFETEAGPRVSQREQLFFDLRSATKLYRMSNQQV